jgi:hypothetical protein
MVYLPVNVKEKFGKNQPARNKKYTVSSVT